MMHSLMLKGEIAGPSRVVQEDEDTVSACSERPSEMEEPREGPQASTSRAQSSAREQESEIREIYKRHLLQDIQCKKADLQYKKLKIRKLELEIKKMEKDRECIICGRTTTAIKRHLTGRHGVKNETELGLLLAFTTGRFKGVLDCSVCDKRRLSRLDCHLTNIHDISGKELTQMLIAAKEECLIRKLADLRACGPDPPMVSELDLAITVKPYAATPEDEEVSSRSPSPPTDTQQSNPALSAPEDQTEASTSALPGPSPTQSSEPINKDRENARLRKSHTTWFVLHMHQKCPSDQFMNLKFLYNFHQIRH
ncbi:hypothetical protein MHYP_G00119460 [Metynnis hypsauchen]